MSTDVVLLSDGEVVANAGAAPVTGGAFWSDTGRVASLAARRDVLIDAIRFRQTQTPVDEEPAAGLVTTVRGLHEGRTVTVLFFRDPLGLDSVRNVSYEIMEISAAGRTPWQESFFAPVPARRLRFLLVPLLRYWWTGPSDSTMTEAELIVDDGTYLRWTTSTLPQRVSSIPGGAPTRTPFFSTRTLGPGWTTGRSSAGGSA